MHTRLVTRNFFSLFLSNVVGQLFTLWAFVRIAAVVGPDGFGKFSFAQVAGLHVLYLADFGLQTLGTRTIAQESGDWSRHVRLITRLRLILAVVCFALLSAGAFLLPKPADVRVLVLLFGLALFPFAVLFEWVFLGLERMDIVGAGRILKGVVFAGIVYVAVDGPARLNEAALAYVAGLAAAALVLLAVYLTTYRWRGDGAKTGPLWPTFVTAFPFAAGALIAQVNFNFGTLALGVALSDAAVGLFSAGYKIVVFLLAFAVVAAANAAFPAMAKAYTRSSGEFTATTERLLRVFVLAALPVGVGGTVLAGRIMDLLYTPDYAGGTIVLQISIWIVVLAMYRVILENALLASGNQQRYLVGYAVAGGITVVGNLSLAPVLGIIAPALVGIAAEGALFGFFALSWRALRWQELMQVTVRPLLAALVMGMVLAWIPWPALPAIGAGAVVYGAALFLVGAVTVRDLRALVRVRGQ